MMLFAAVAALATFWMAGLAAAWTTEIHGGVNDDAISAVTTDASGSVYAAGSILTPGGTFGVRKLAPSNGAGVWEGEGSQGMMLIAPGGDPVAAGGNVRRYSAATGAQVWSVPTGGIGPHSLAIDPAGFVAYAGRGGGGPGPDMLVQLYALADGAEIWSVAINGAANGYDSAEAVAIAENGDVIAGGYLYNPGVGPGNRDFTIVRLASGDGSEVWRTEIDAPTGDGAVNDLLVTADGDVVAVGSLQLSNGPDFTVIRLAGASGAEEWRYVVDGDIGNSGDHAVAVAVTPGGAILAAGTIDHLVTASDILVVKLGAELGNLIWSAELNATDLHDRGRVLTADSQGNAIVGGYTHTADTNRDFTVAKLAAADGGELWRVVVNGSSNGNDEVLGVAVDPEDNVIAGGYLDNTATGTRRDALVVKIAGISGSFRVCADGLDNDGDGGVDFDPVTAADPTGLAGVGDAGCRDPNWTLEDPQCQDGINNDPGQDPDPGLIDFDGGLSIFGAGDPRITDPDPQCVGLAWKNKERTGCGLGFELALILPGLMWLHRRRRRLH